MQALRRLSLLLATLLCYAVLFSQTVHAAKRAHCPFAARPAGHLRLPLAVPRPPFTLGAVRVADTLPPTGHRFPLSFGQVGFGLRGNERARISVLQLLVQRTNARPQICEQDPPFAQRV